MIYAVYFVPREGVHPHATLADYEWMWPIMQRSVNRMGHELVHITDLHSAARGDSVWRTDVDPATTVYSRDVAWLRFVEALPNGEQACMIEPDTVMLREIPPLGDDKDVLFLRRPESRVPGWFKMAKNTAAPIYRQIVANYTGFPDELRAFHGDIGAMHRALGIADGDAAHTIPSEACGVRIEVRDWTRYGFRKAPRTEPFFLQFKGHSKGEMRRFQ